MRPNASERENEEHDAPEDSRIDALMMGICLIIIGVITIIAVL